MQWLQVERCLPDMQHEEVYKMKIFVFGNVAAGKTFFVKKEDDYLECGMDADL